MTGSVQQTGQRSRRRARRLITLIFADRALKLLQRARRHPGVERALERERRFIRALSRREGR